MRNARCTGGVPSRSSIGLSLQKVQHNIQSALNKRRDSGRILKQMKVRLHNIAQDMYNQKILNRSCGEEIVRSSLARARKAATEKRRRPRAAEWGEACQTGLQRHHRKSDFLNRRGCSPEEARSDLRRITTQLHHTQHVGTSCHLHITISFTNVAQLLGLFSTVFGSKETKQASSNELIRPAPVPALVNTRKFGLYTGTRVGEA